MSNGPESQPSEPTSGLARDSNTSTQRVQSQSSESPKESGQPASRAPQQLSLSEKLPVISISPEEMTDVSDNDQPQASHDEGTKTNMKSEIQTSASAPVKDFGFDWRTVNSSAMTSLSVDKNPDKARSLYSSTLAEWVEKIETAEGNVKSENVEAVCMLWLEYANMEKVLKQFKQAVKVFESAVTCPIAGEKAIVWIRYAQFCVERQKLGNAHKVYLRAVEAVPFPEVLRVWEAFLAFANDLNQNASPPKPPVSLQALQESVLSKEKLEELHVKIEEQQKPKVPAQADDDDVVVAQIKTPEDILAEKIRQADATGLVVEIKDAHPSQTPEARQPPPVANVPPPSSHQAPTPQLSQQVQTPTPPYTPSQQPAADPRRRRAPPSYQGSPMRRQSPDDFQPFRGQQRPPMSATRQPSPSFSPQLSSSHPVNAVDLQPAFPPTNRAEPRLRPAVIPPPPVRPTLLFDPLPDEIPTPHVPEGVLVNLSEVLRDSTVFNAVQQLKELQMQKDHEYRNRWEGLYLSQSDEGAELARTHKAEEANADPRTLSQVVRQHQTERECFSTKCRAAQSVFANVTASEFRQLREDQQKRLQALRVPLVFVTESADKIDLQRHLVRLILTAKEMSGPAAVPAAPAPAFPPQVPAPHISQPSPFSRPMEGPAPMAHGMHTAMPPRPFLPPHAGPPRLPSERAGPMAFSSPPVNVPPPDRRFGATPPSRRDSPIDRSRKRPFPESSPRDEYRGNRSEERDLGPRSPRQRGMDFGPRPRGGGRFGRGDGGQPGRGRVGELLPGEDRGRGGRRGLGGRGRGGYGPGLPDTRGEGGGRFGPPSGFPRMAPRPGAPAPRGSYGGDPFGGFGGRGPAPGPPRGGAFRGRGRGRRYP